MKNLLMLVTLYFLTLISSCKDDKKNVLNTQGTETNYDDSLAAVRAKNYVLGDPHLLGNKKDGVFAKVRTLKFVDHYLEVTYWIDGNVFVKEKLILSYIQNQNDRYRYWQTTLVDDGVNGTVNEFKEEFYPQPYNPKRPVLEREFCINNDSTCVVKNFHTNVLSNFDSGKKKVIYALYKRLLREIR